MKSQEIPLGTLWHCYQMRGYPAFRDAALDLGYSSDEIVNFVRLQEGCVDDNGIFSVANTKKVAEA